MVQTEQEANFGCRVCQFHKTAEQRSKCINQDVELRGPEQKGDAFPDAPSIDVNALNS